MYLSDVPYQDVGSLARLRFALQGFVFDFSVPFYLDHVYESVNITLSIP